MREPASNRHWKTLAAKDWAGLRSSVGFKSKSIAWEKPFVLHHGRSNGRLNVIGTEKAGKIASH